MTTQEAATSAPAPAPFYLVVAWFGADEGEEPGTIRIWRAPTPELAATMVDVFEEAVDMTAGKGGMRDVVVEVWPRQESLDGRGEMLERTPHLDVFVAVREHCRRNGLPAPERL